MTSGVTVVACGVEDCPHLAADVTECRAWLRAGAPAPAPSHLVAGVPAPR